MAFSGIYFWLVPLVLCAGAVALGLLIWLLVRISRKAPSAAEHARRSAAERLRELDELKQQGLVTEPEWARQRAAIISSV